MLKRLIYSLLLFSFIVFNISAQTSQNHYFEAFSSINLMLSGNDSLDFKKAVYLTENAYFDNELDNEAFDEVIRVYSSLCKGIMESGNIVYSGADKDKASAQCAVFLFMTDSIPISVGNDIVVSVPFTYNYEDFAGQTEWSNTFVSTLMQTNKGNCHSLPFLYKIIMDELGQECNLALAPNHIYIKAQNKAVGWYNIELTCSDFPTDAWLMASGYIHIDAIRNGIYMNSLNTKQSVALCLVDLAQGYQAKFGLQDGSFILQCCDTALEHFPDYINALLLKAETITELYKQSTPDSEENRKLLADMNDLFSYIHKLGYRKMPKEMYTNWLNSLNSQETNQKVRSIVSRKDKL
ncbi:MAG: hypothetical protein E6772_14550 [Dysgonomonas sp.]|nr:hypothetical protein [Dysgonomonas sp.]